MSQEANQPGASQRWHYRLNSTRLNPTIPDSLAPELRARRVLRAACVSYALLIVPVAVLWLTSLEVRPGWLPQLRWLVDTLWLASGAIGLLFGARSWRLANHKTDGFGILAVLLHICSLFLLGCLAVAGAGGG